ncbi:MAG: sialidase family protein, partial [Bacteroidota bacterium]
MVSISVNPRSKRAIYLLSSFVLLSLVSTVWLYTTASTDSFQKLDLEERARGRYEHEYLITHDFKTNTIPAERLVEAREYTSKKLLSRKKDAISNINWTERGPNNVAGRTRAILIDKNDSDGSTVWAGGVGGGLWKSTDSGDTWTAVNDFFDNIAISTIAQDPNTPNTMYFGTGESFGGGVRGMGIWKSTNGGDTWVQLSSTAPGDEAPNYRFQFVNKIVVTPTGAVVAAVSGVYCNVGGIVRSTDGGDTWSHYGGGSDAPCGSVKWAEAGDVEVAANGDLWAAFGRARADGIYKSTNDGVSWTRVFKTFDYEYRIELATAPSNSNYVYALIENTQSQGVPRIIYTDDAGEDWYQSSNPPFIEDQLNCTEVTADWTRDQDWYNLIASVKPDDHKVLIVGGIDLFKSTNSGADGSWTQISSWFGGCNRPDVHADQHGIAWVNDNTAWFGNDGGLYLSSDLNQTKPSFIFKGNGYNVTQFYGADMHPEAGSEIMLAGAQDNGTQYFNQPNLGNTIRVTGGDGAFSHIDQTNGDMQISQYVYNNYWVTTNNWSSNVYVGHSNNTGLFINPTDYDDASNLLYASYDTDGYLRWNNPATRGNSFTEVFVSNVNATISAIRLSPNVSNRLYLGLTNGRVLRVDGVHNGTSKIGTILPVGLQGNGVISCIEIEVGNEDHILVTSSSYGA